MSNLMRILLGIFILLMARSSVGLPPSLYFRNLTTANGLSHRKVNCILEDRRGFMWFGTDDGLNRYDGNKFLVFRNDPANPATLSGNIVTSMLEDREGIIWIATADGGLTRYDHRASAEKQFRQFKHSFKDSSSIPVNIINAIIEDKFGFLWLATSGNGVLRFNKSGEVFQSMTSYGSTALALALDNKGTIWVGREGRGLLRINPATLYAEADPRYNDLYTKLPHMVVTSLFRDSRGHMWLGSWDKVIYRYNSLNGREDVFSHNNNSNSFGKDDAISFAEDLRRRVWVGGKQGGLYVYDASANEFYQYRHDPSKEGTLADNQVNCIYRDRSGNMWLGTNRGISVHSPALQQFEQSFLPEAGNSEPLTVYDFMERDDGALLIGTGKGIYLLKDGKWSHHRITHNGQAVAATKFYKSAANTTYLGTDLSLFRLDPFTFSIQLLPNTENDIVMKRIIESRVVSIAEDTIEGHPVLLVSPYGHYLAYYDFELQQWVSRQDSSRNIINRFRMRDHMIRRFFKSRNGRLWLANTKSGLGEWFRNPEPEINYYANMPNQAGSISNNHVFDIAEDAKGNLWISTYGGGLHYFDTRQKKFRHIPGSQNLGEGIQTDDHGNVWIVANGCLHKYSISSQSYITFQLPDIEKTGGIHGNIFRAKDGRMFVAGSGYFIAFHPDSVRDLTSEPGVFVTDFKISNASFNHLLQRQQIELRHTQNYLSFEFAAPSFNAPVFYSWKLEGVDPDWVSGENNTVSYPNLSGGKYTFKVRATTKPGTWSDDIALVTFRIIPPFWKRPLFFIACGLLVIGATYAGYRYRINEILKRQEIRNRIAQDLHDNVGSTLSSISVYSQVAKIHNAQGNRDDLQNVLLRIAATSSEMISEMNDIVWTINPRNDSMQKILQRMESFAKPLLHTQQIQFTFNYDPAVMQLNLEMEQRKNFYLIFKEAVTNALKYSGCRNLAVTVQYRNHRIELVVQDDGVGFDPETIDKKSAQSLSGNGLVNMERRAREMNGQCTINSVPGKGTTVTLQFPVP